MCSEVPDVIGGHPVESRCIKEFSSSDSPLAELTDLNGCKLVCGKYGTIWPKPTGKVVLSKSRIDLIPDSVYFNVDVDSRTIKYMLQQLEEIFKIYMYATHPAFESGQYLLLPTEPKKVRSNFKLFCAIMDEVVPTNDKNHFG